MSIERSSQVDKHGQRWIPPAALKISEISHIHPSAGGELLLREPLFGPKFPNDPAELLSYIHASNFGNRLMIGTSGEERRKYGGRAIVGYVQVLCPKR